MIIKSWDSQQSVDLKWMLRKGLENGMEISPEGDLTVGKNLEVDGKITINSANDLVTKDGSSFGGGGSSTSLKDRNASAEVEGGERSTFWFLQDDRTVFSVENGADTAATLVSIGKTYDGKVYITNIRKADNLNGINIDLPAKSGTFALLDDIQRFQHSITMKFGTNGEIRFTAISSKNIVIDSIQDLIEVFGNTSIACSGVTKANTIATMISIGATSLAIAVYEMPIAGGTAISDSYITLGFTEISDLVTTI